MAKEQVNNFWRISFVGLPGILFVLHLLIQFKGKESNLSHGVSRLGLCFSGLDAGTSWLKSIVKKSYSFMAVKK